MSYEEKVYEDHYSSVLIIALLSSSLNGKISLRKKKINTKFSAVMD